MAPTPSHVASPAPSSMSIKLGKRCHNIVEMVESHVTLTCVYGSHPLGIPHRCCVPVAAAVYSGSFAGLFGCTPTHSFFVRVSAHHWQLKALGTIPLVVPEKCQSFWRRRGLHRRCRKAQMALMDEQNPTEGPGQCHAGAPSK